MCSYDVRYVYTSEPNFPHLQGLISKPTGTCRKQSSHPTCHSPNPQESTSNLRRGRLPAASFDRAPFGLKFLQPLRNSVKILVVCGLRLPSRSSLVSCSSLLFVGDTCLATGRTCGVACVSVDFGVFRCSAPLTFGRNSLMRFANSCPVTGSAGYFSRYEWSSSGTETSTSLSVGRLRPSLCV